VYVVLFPTDIFLTEANFRGLSTWEGREEMQRNLESDMDLTFTLVIV